MSGGLATLLRGGMFGASAGLGAVTIMNNPNGLSGLTSVFHGFAGNALRPGVNSNGEIVGLLKPLNDQLIDLSNEVSRLRMQQVHSPLYYGSLLPSWTTIITVGGLGVIVLYGFGFSFNDFMYVTKKALNIAVQALEESIEQVGVALDLVKRELSYKLGLVEEKIDQTRESLEQKISKEIGEVKSDLSAVGEDVKGVARVQAAVQDMVEGLETQFRFLENKVEGASDKLSNANEGISLLCNVVVNNMNVGRPDYDPSKVLRDSESIYQRLLRFTEESLEPVRSASTYLYGKRRIAPSSTQGIKALLSSTDESGKSK